MPFSQLNGEYQDLHIYLCTSFIFPIGVTCAHDFNRRIDTETDKALDIGKSCRLA